VYSHKKNKATSTGKNLPSVMIGVDRRDFYFLWGGNPVVSLAVP